MLIARKAVRNLIFPIITGLGLEKLASSFSKNNNLILCFHGVSNYSNVFNNRHMPAKDFEELIVYLKANFEIAAVKDLFSDLPGNRKRIAITFDDGYLNNYAVAWPILEKHNIPASFYITTEAFEISSYFLWPELFDALKLTAGTEKILFNNEEFRFSKRQLLHVGSSISIYDYVKKMGEERQSAFSDFILKYDVKTILKKLPAELTVFCSEQQIRDMSASPLIEIGSHTHRHYNLSNINAGLAEKELTRSKNILEGIIRKPVLSIAYPDGDYSEEVKTIAERAGYAYQLAVNFKSAGDASDKRIRSRYTISNTTSVNTNKILINLKFKTAGF